MVSLESFTITGSNEVVKAGDSVFVRCSENENAKYMAHVWSIKADDVNGDVKDTIGGRSEFYGKKELLLAIHFTTVDAAAILHKINVHSFVNYTKLKSVGPHDYVCRFEHEIGSGYLSPVYCKCRLPFNPNVFMLKCEACKERYHPACINMTTDEAKKLYDFTCDKCSKLSMHMCRNNVISSNGWIRVYILTNGSDFRFYNMCLYLYHEKLEQQLDKQARAAEEREQAAKQRQQAAEEQRAAEEQARTAKERQQAAEERERAAEERVKDIANMMKPLKPPQKLYLNLDDPNACVNRSHGDTVLVNKGSFIITDDLKITPFSLEKSIELLNSFGVEYIELLDERTLYFGLEEFSNLLKWSLVTENPLTKLVTEGSKTYSCITNSTLSNSAQPDQTLKTVKLLVHKSTKKVLCAQVDNFFIELLFSFLTIPLGTVKRLTMDSSSSLGINNVYQSISSLDDGNKVEGNFLKEQATFIVSDALELVISPHISTMSKFTFGIPVGHIEVQEVSIGESEALIILKASLTSTSVLTDCLQELREKPKALTISAT
ncbi:hypothetical protein CTI12_AA071150 [Artemisia annua]|uniref:Zinc finger PHD-type domain-containing protein n=1 Tax=Artemisia annua TaxID=35608 RepID=A0A2U1Q5X8_ARTAN|nr:hypothetical protein CTI12_AA071150 [Artemisia annua]